MTYDNQSPRKLSREFDQFRISESSKWRPSSQLVNYERAYLVLTGTKPQGSAHHGSEALTEQGTLTHDILRTRSQYEVNLRVS